MPFQRSVEMGEVRSSSPKRMPHAGRPSEHDSALEQEALLRLRQIIGDVQAEPPIPALVPVSRSTWWAGVASGRFPRPIKLGPRLPVWRRSDILALMREAR